MHVYISGTSKLASACDTTVIYHRIYRLNRTS